MFKTMLAAGLVLVALPSATSSHSQNIRIATEGAHPPFNYLDVDNRLSGFDVDIAHALCERVRANCTIVTRDWNGIIPGLLANEYDAIIASMTVTEGRKEKLAFTNRYYVSRLAVAVAKDSPLSDAKPASLRGLRVGALSASTQADYAQDNYGHAGADVKLYASQQVAFDDLQKGRLDAVVASIYPLDGWLKQQGRDCCKLLGLLADTGGETAIALRQSDNELRQEMNKALAALMADGTYKRISAKYFDFDINQ